MNRLVINENKTSGKLFATESSRKEKIDELNIKTQHIKLEHSTIFKDLIDLYR